MSAVKEDIVCHVNFLEEIVRKPLNLAGFILLKSFEI
jgi:hypothetical protein